MVRAASLCLLFAACIYGVASFSLYESSPATIPVIMWSDKQMFSSPQVLETISTGDMEFALSSLFKFTPNTKDSKLANYFNNVEAPEVVVLFVEPELATDRVPIVASAYSSATGGSFSNLKDALESAGSSLVIPYATAAEVSLLDEPLLDIHDSMKGSIFISRVAGSELFSRLAHQVGVKTVAIDSLIAELKAANAFANGVTDLVVVCFDKATGKQAVFATHDELIGSISGSIRAATKGNYVAMYSANTPVTSNLIWTFEQTSAEEYEYYHGLGLVFANGTNNTNITNSTLHKINYFPGPLIEVYLLVSILITMVFTGGCAIFSLQTPDRWEAPKVKREI